MDRKTIALKCININKGKGLELGPLVSPLVSKEEANVFYVDHVSTEELKEKYDDHPIKGHPVALEDIAPIDFVLGSNSLKDTLNGKKFDYVIASHVMEHIPDLVRWFADVEAILKEGGILSLVIPDKRFTFDIMRNESRPADVIGAYLDRQTRSSSVIMYDYMSNFRHNIVAAEVWQNPYADYGKKPKNSDKRVYDICLENIKPGNYVDAHCFVFTPYSFFEAIKVLIDYDLFGYEVAYFKNTLENQLEFYVSLRKANKSTRTQKRRSLPKLTKPMARHELENKILNLNARNTRLEEAIVRLETELQNLTTSKSWKLTEPLRRALGAMKKPGRNPN